MDDHLNDKDPTDPLDHPLWLDGSNALDECDALLTQINVEYGREDVDMSGVSYLLKRLIETAETVRIYSLRIRAEVQIASEAPADRPAEQG